MIRRVVLVIVALVAVLWVAKNVLAKAAVISAVKSMTGLRVDVQRLDIGVVNTRIAITGLKVMNPSGYTDPVMMSVPEVFVDYDLAAFLKGQAHIEAMRLHLERLLVERDAQGRLNLQALNVVKRSQGEPVPKKQEQKAEQMPFRVDVLDLRLGTVVYKDSSAVGTPTVREFPLNVEERFEDIHDPYAFAGVIINRALTRTALGGLRDIEGLTQSLQSTYSGVVDMALNEAVRGLQGGGQGAVDSAGKALKETGDVLKNLLGQ
jgi:uncharacterized protein involved in outer membrane biogenesis